MKKYMCLCLLVLILSCTTNGIHVQNTDAELDNQAQDMQTGETQPEFDKLNGFSDPSIKWIQTFTLSGDMPYLSTGVETSNSDVLLLGKLDNNLYIVKINSHGDLIAEKNFDFGIRSYGVSIQKQQDDRYLVVAYAGMDTVLLEIDSNLEVYSTKRFEHKMFEALFPTDSGYIVFGAQTVLQKKTTTIFSALMSDNGELSDVKTYDIMHFNVVNSIVNDNNNFYASGYGHKGDNKGNIGLFLTFDRNRELITQKQFTDRPSNKLTGLFKASDVFLAIRWRQFDGAFLSAFNTEGVLLWENAFTPWGDRMNFSHINNSTIVWEGYTANSSKSGDRSIQISETDFTGNITRKKSLDIGIDYATLFSVIPLKDGSWLLSTGNYSDNHYILKCDPDILFQ